MQVMSWFYSKMEEFLPLIEKTKKRLLLADGLEDSDGESDDEDDEEYYDIVRFLFIDPSTLVQAHSYWVWPYRKV